MAKRERDPITGETLYQKNKRLWIESEGERKEDKAHWDFVQKRASRIEIGF